MDTHWNLLLALVTAAATVAMAAFAWRSLQLSRELMGQQAVLVEMQEKNLWLAGALESHSALMLRIEAARGIRPGATDSAPIDVIWWDPEYADEPPKHRHGEPVALGPIRMYVPPDVRAKRDDAERTAAAM